MIKLRVLGATEYSEWDTFVGESPTGTVFAYSWWLKAACKNPLILGCFDEGRLIAGLPLFAYKKWGIRMCTPPALSSTWSPVLGVFVGNASQRAQREAEVLGLLAEELSNHTFVFQKFHPRLRSWLPFKSRGFWQTVRFTYQFDDLTDLAQIWRDMDHRTRGEIRKAERQGLKAVVCGIKEVFEAETKTFQRQKLRHPRAFVDMERLYNAAQANDAGECFAVKDEYGRVHAAGFIVWDSRSSHYLAAGADPALRSSGATPALAWHMIQFSATKSKRFDFSGSSVEQIERLFRHIGARQVPYFWIVKAPALARFYLALQGKL